MRLRLREIPLKLDEEESDLPGRIAEMLGLAEGEIEAWTIVRKGIDARRKPNVLRVFTVDLSVADPQQVLDRNSTNSALVEAPEASHEVVVRLQKGPRVAVVGMGPAGLFAALRLAESGAEVTLLERGKPVAERLQDVENFWQRRQFLPESNVQFGEGGAGTFSDGKLTSRLNDPLMRHVLETLVRFGAPAEILYQAKPHVGSDRLRAVLVKFRLYLQKLGVDIRFRTKLTGIEWRDQHCTLQLNDQQELPADRLVLAIGHSARDTYQMLTESGVCMEQKAFAIGLRVEHPLELINSIQYGMKMHPQLPAAEYSLTWNNKQSGRGVYSFCMCPGGEVINAASEQGGVVVNGMSHYRRDSEYSNSALVVAVKPADFTARDPLAGVRFQRHWEQQAYIAGGQDWGAPAQPLQQFLTGRGGGLHSSCRPAVRSADLSTCLPQFVVNELRCALPHFNRKMRGFVSDDATLIGVETRTSAPLRILRDRQFASVSQPGLYPAGEGAGYAGGIMSAAVDGLKVANQIIKNHTA